VSLLSSITAADFHGRHVAAINAVAQRVQQIAGLMLRFPALDRSTLRLLVCSDASFTNRDDLPSQLGHIVFLADASGSCVFLSWSSHRSRRIQPAPRNSAHDEHDRSYFDADGFIWPF
jgi:hypothetical protein